MSLFSATRHGNWLLNRRSGMPSRYAMRHSRSPLFPLRSWVFHARSLIIIFKNFITKPPHTWKLLSTTYSILRQSFFYNVFFIFTDEYIIFHLNYHNITLLHRHRILFVHLSHKTLFTYEVQCNISP